MYQNRISNQTELFFLPDTQISLRTNLDHRNFATSFCWIRKFSRMGTASTEDAYCLKWNDFHTRYFSYVRSLDTTDISNLTCIQNYVRIFCISSFPLFSQYHRVVLRLEERVRPAGRSHHVRGPAGNSLKLLVGHILGPA